MEPVALASGVHYNGPEAFREAWKHFTDDFTKHGAHKMRVAQVNALNTLAFCGTPLPVPGPGEPVFQYNKRISSLKYDIEEAARGQSAMTATESECFGALELNKELAQSIAKKWVILKGNETFDEHDDEHHDGHSNNPEEQKKVSAKKERALKDKEKPKKSNDNHKKHKAFIEKHPEAALLFGAMYMLHENMIAAITNDIWKNKLYYNQLSEQEAIDISRHNVISSIFNYKLDQRKAGHEDMSLRAFIGSSLNRFLLNKLILANTIKHKEGVYHQASSSAPYSDSISIASSAPDLTAPDNAHDISLKESTQHWEAIISKILGNTSNEAQILKARFGFPPYDQAKDFSEIGEEFGLSREGARQQFLKAMRIFKSRLKEQNYDNEGIPKSIVYSTQPLQSHHSFSRAAGT